MRETCSKICVICEKRKTFNYFYKSKISDDGYKPHCSNCGKKMSNDYNKSHREERREYNRKYKETHQEQIKKWRDDHKDYYKYMCKKWRDKQKLMPLVNELLERFNKDNFI